MTQKLQEKQPDTRVLASRQVQVPHSYFRKAKMEYADWRWAMIREFIQNSYDAQATTIDFRLSVNDRDAIELSVGDDGIGMDRDTLENVLLCMGGSRKPEGAIGGFGYAKAILFFAHQSYTIRTRNLRVDGNGGEYRLSTENTVVTGTQITVELDDDSDLFDEWRERIEHYAAHCYMEYATGRPVAIRLDGDELPQNNDSAYDFYVQTPVGMVWYNEEPDNCRSEFVVFVSGLPMFAETFYSRTNQSALVGGIELESGSAVLTANRDGFNAETSDQFAKVVGDLIQDQSKVRYGQALDLTINLNRAIRHDRQNPSGTDDDSGSAPSALLRLLCPETTQAGVLAGYTAALARITQQRYPANFHIKVESLAARRSANSQAYITTSALVAEMNKQRNAKLAHRWRAALIHILCCSWALDNGVTCYDASGQLIDDWDSLEGAITDLQLCYQEIPLETGFCFIENTLGLCSVPLDGKASCQIYINPLLLTEETRFRPGDLLDVAYHEAAHLWESHHGEAFCRVEHKLRQSVRRWMTEREFIASIAGIKSL